jgi:hypothetical protein
LHLAGVQTRSEGHTLTLIQVIIRSFTAISKNSSAIRVGKRKPKPMVSSETLSRFLYLFGTIHTSTASAVLLLGMGHCFVGYIDQDTCSRLILLRVAYSSKRRDSSTSANIIRRVKQGVPMLMEFEGVKAFRGQSRYYPRGSRHDRASPRTEICY